ncbi:MAG: PqiC family protein [Halioglobus sp.]|jgi:uncharacterized protein
MKLLVLPLLLLVAACVSQPPQTSTYLLRADGDPQSLRREPATDIAFGRLELAGYIDQPGLVLKTGEGEVHAARYHQWAEPLRASLEALLQSEISRQLGRDIRFQPDGAVGTRIDVIIDQLHGNADGEAELVAAWRLRRIQGGDEVHRFVGSQPLERNGYAALVEAERQLLLRLAGAITASVVAAAGPEGHQ